MVELTGNIDDSGVLAWKTGPLIADFRLIQTDRLLRPPLCGVVRV